MLVRLFHEYGFATGAKVPGSQMIGPFSWMKPSRLEHPGPPFSQIVISFTGAPALGAKKKKRLPSVWLFASTATEPEYSSP